MDLELIDIRTLLEDAEIEIHISGKNVTSGWIEINCPFCSDPSFHLGISPTNIFHCWRCGEKGNIIKLLKALMEMNFYQTIKLLEKYSFEENFEEEYVPQEKKEIYLPREASKKMPKEAKQYLESRGFDAQFLSSKYKLKFCSFLGDYKFRIIIPVFKKKQMVTFTSRDYTNKAKIKVLNASNNIKDFLYNIDSVKHKALIVEGIFDAWKFGNGAISIFGTEYTKRQVLEIANLGLEYAGIIFDDEEDAQEKAKKFALAISPYIEEVEVIHLESDKGKDPAEIFSDIKEGEKFKQEIFNKIKEGG